MFAAFRKSPNLPYAASFLLVIVAGLAASFLLPLKRQGVVSVKLATRARPAPQSSSSRAWRSVEMRELRRLPMDQLGMLRAGPAGDAFLMSWGDHIIRRVDSAGNLGKAYGKGIGYAPGQSMSPSDFAVSDSGDVWVCDPNLKKVIKFSPDGEISEFKNLNPPVLRLVVLKDGIVAVRMRTDDTFATYNDSLRQQAAFSGLIDNQNKYFIAGDGWLAGDSSSTAAVFVGAHLGLIVGVSPGGGVVYSRSVVGESVMPLLNIDRRDGISIAINSVVYSKGAAISGNNVVVLRDADKQGPVARRSVLDVYRRSDGAYRYSVALSERYHDIAISGDHVYLGKDDSLAVLSAKLPEA